MTPQGVILDEKVVEKNQSGLVHTSVHWLNLDHHERHGFVVDKIVGLWRRG